MAWSRRRLVRLAGAVAIAADLHGFAAAAQASPNRSGNQAAVRGDDGRARALIEWAARRSPTVAALLADMDGTDVVVVVQVTFLAADCAGDLRIGPAPQGWRYLFVRVDQTRSPVEQAEILGHELQHAREVTEAPEVHDEAGLMALMARIGWRTGRGTFETDSARLVGMQVRRELLGGEKLPPAREDTTDSSGTPWETPVGPD